MVLPTAQQVTQPGSFLADQFRKGLIKLAILTTVWLFYAVVHGYIPWRYIQAVWAALRWVLGALLALKLLGPLATLALCRWRWWTDAPRLHGRVAIVTGASAGVGRQSALQLAQLGCTVVLACRSEERGKVAEESLQREIQQAWAGRAGGTGVCGRVEYQQLDLADLASVRSFASAVTNKYPRIDILVNNGAGPGQPPPPMMPPLASAKPTVHPLVTTFALSGLICACMRDAAGLNSFAEPSLTADGFEEVFGVNYLGHFLLTQLLLPSLQASATHHREQQSQSQSQSVSKAKASGFCGPRIVNVSSVMHRHSSCEEMLSLAGHAAEIGAATAAAKLLGGAQSAVVPPGKDNAMTGSTYSASKRAMVVFTGQLDRRLWHEALKRERADNNGANTPVDGKTHDEMTRVRAVCVNPGAVNSEIWRSMPFFAWWGRRALGALLFLEPEDGAATTLFVRTHTLAHAHAHAYTRARARARVYMCVCINMHMYTLCTWACMRCAHLVTHTYLDLLPLSILLCHNVPQGATARPEDGWVSGAYVTPYWVPFGDHTHLLSPTIV
jgi:NAD(P)-dependent dehydrogenase (short-subunit alcohol dehydrogenase family)